MSKQDIISYPKHKRYESKKYRDFVRDHPCCVCGRTPSDPHHVSKLANPAMGRKASDTFCVPLCREHHTECHNMGYYTFWDEYYLDPKLIIIRLSTEWIKQEGI